MRKRSSYRPRFVNENPLNHLQVTPKERRAAAMLHFHTALQAIASGKHPGEQEWRSLSDAVNTIETLVDMGKLDYAEVMPTICDAIEAMVAASRRFKAGQGMRLDAKGLAALRQVIDMYEQCMDGFTEAEMRLATHRTQERIAALLRSKKHQATVVAL